MIETKDVLFDEIHQLKLDVYQPNPSSIKANGAAIIDIHGGGWFKGDKSSEGNLASHLVGQGYLVIVPNYRLAPDNPYPAAVEDIETAYQWLKASDYAFDRSKIGAMGMSSGGNLSVEMAISEHIPVASWSGIIDLDEWVDSHPTVKPSPNSAPAPNTNPDQIDQGGDDDAYYKWFVLNYVKGDLNLLHDASLLHRVTESTAPVLMCNSLDELAPVSGVQKLQTQLLAHNVPCETIFYAGSRHGEAYLNDAMQPTFDFFNQYLKLNN
ncbi:alpha/beta hydrolase [Levilactobacillus bambusae]|uniref:Alpha/beta hydrolase n=2 Tax=Levilactobacillus bambusae TaxID=2024736 RepID=A0A2V1N374_9LACO|nr:alpha/beta hydrolase [Levilactobacillus bambusae]